MAAVPMLRNFKDTERELLRAPPVLTAEQIEFIQSPGFTRHSDKWARLRYDFLRDHEGRCQCCGRGQADGRKINVDHIYPRRSHPQFALTYANLQVLCSACNKGKGNRDHTNWRYRQRNPPTSPPPEIPPCPLSAKHRCSFDPPRTGRPFGDARAFRIAEALAPQPNAAARSRATNNRLRTRSLRDPAPTPVRTTDDCNRQPGELIFERPDFASAVEAANALHERG
jgi:hypothetical protein